MCGICGIYSPGEHRSADTVLRMMAQLRHRGPDGCGYYRDADVVLGHTRLSIIDSAGGVQPMTGEDEAVWVTFNGEIFNYLELAADLRARGHRFRTRSDTEVVVHAWEEWGRGCFARFNGQWALAIWDRRSGELTLSRDRYGIHPLFYARAGSHLAFASEVKALFCDDEIDRALDPHAVDELLTFWAPLPPRTPFAGVRQVPPGCTVTVRGSSDRVSEYWTPSFPEGGSEPAQDLEENTAQLREAVIDATRLRFQRSDVPVGVYLSGGIDSAVTAATITRYAGRDVHTFSLRFRDDEFDEGRYQELMSARLGATHHELEIAADDIARSLPRAIWHTESAILRSAPVPMMMLSESVRAAGFPVVVTGEGADEVLAGYDIFREAKVRAFVARNPDSAQRRGAINLLYPWMRRSPNQAPAFAQSFFAHDLDLEDPALSHRPRWSATASLKSMLEPEWAVPGPRRAEQRLLASMPRSAERWDPLARAQWLEIKTLLAGYLLPSQGDRMLMASSVEGRFPFLDHRVFELAARFPARHKILGLDEKHVLKRAFADLVPSEIVRRPKQPYRAPDAAGFFSSSPPEWLREVTSARAIAEAGLFRPAVAERVLEKSRARAGRGLGNSDSMRLMALLSLQLLHTLFVRDWSRPTALPLGPVAVFDTLTEGRGTP